MFISADSNASLSDYGLLLCPGIGHSFRHKLKAINVTSVPGLRRLPLPVLKQTFGEKVCSAPNFETLVVSTVPLRYSSLSRVEPSYIRSVEELMTHVS